MIYLHVHKHCFCLVFGTPILIHHLVSLRAPDESRPWPNYVCSTCDRTFIRLEHLKRHERSCTCWKPYKCPDCARSFYRHSTLLGHRRVRHPATKPSSQPQNARGSTADNTAASSMGANTKNGKDAYEWILPRYSNLNKDFNLDMQVPTTTTFQRGLEERGRSLRRRDSKQVLHASPGNP
jgi:DNA-directed RNA polymerase subunit RPC12/RpoP